MRRILVIFVYFLSYAVSQNDGLVKTYYPNEKEPGKQGALQTEGNYTNGVRDGLWVFWYNGEAFEDYGEDGIKATLGNEDAGEGNGVRDTTDYREILTIDLDGDDIFDKPNKKMEGSYTSGNREGEWTIFYNNESNTKKEQTNYFSGKLNGQLIKWFENGNKVEEGIYEEGKQNGLWTWYYETGIKKKRLNLSMDNRTVCGHNGLVMVKENQKEFLKMVNVMICGHLGT